MHASTISIELTALCNVHLFFPVPLKLSKIKIVKYSITIFWWILWDCKVHSSFWQHCSSCNIGFPSIVTNNITSKMNAYNSSRHIYNLITATRKKSCSVRKCMVHIKNRFWSVQPLHRVVLARFSRWYYKITPRNLDPENIVKDNFNYEVSGYSD